VLIGQDERCLRESLPLGDKSLVFFRVVARPTFEGEAATERQRTNARRGFQEESTGTAERIPKAFSIWPVVRRSEESGRQSLAKGRLMHILPHSSAMKKFSRGVH
jgi:hypothetical protein